MNYAPSLKAKAAAELELRRRQRKGAIPAAWNERIPQLFGDYFPHPFSEPHAELWGWADAIQADSAPTPFVAIWPRGRGKSTTVEAVVADAAVRQARVYCMYVCGTQDQADKHVQTIARMLERKEVAACAPDVGRPRRSKNGNQTWNRQMVRAETGFAVEAIGLNKAVRGQKIDWARPDLIVFDDIDERHDSELTTAKKEAIITDSILPAGASNCAVLFAQNLIHSDSIAAKLARLPGAEGAAAYLTGRTISGPYPAVADLRYRLEPSGEGYRWVISGGRSLWQGFTLEVCENELNRVGPPSYERESQHEVDNDDPNALMSQEDFDRTRVTDCPDLVRVAVAVDPPGGATECGIVAGGKARRGNDWHGYTLEDNSQPAGTKPEAWAREVLKTYHRHGADTIFVETNFGGDMVAATIRQAKLEGPDGKVIVDGSKVKVQAVRASRGKVARAEPVATVFQQGRGHHVGSFDKLEKEWRTYVPGVSDSPNRLDAEVWLYAGLGLVPETTPDLDLSGMTKMSTWSL